MFMAYWRTDYMHVIVLTYVSRILCQFIYWLQRGKCTAVQYFVLYNHLAQKLVAASILFFWLGVCVIDGNFNYVRSKIIQPWFPAHVSSALPDTFPVVL